MDATAKRPSIFITGAASGIGRATAELFANKGWFCGLFDINENGLKEAAKAIGEDNCVTGLLDVRNRDDWSEAVAAFSKATDGLMNVLFNNAGVGRHGWFEEISQDDSDWVIDVNLKGVVNGVYAALPLLKTSGGRIVNTGSASGFYGSPRLAVYSATKFAVRGLTEALNLELEGVGVSCTSLMPFFVDTPILEMARCEGDNERGLTGQIDDMDADVYPVSLAAERAWDAAHGNDIHYTVGKRANQLSFAARFLPKRLRKQIASSLPTRSKT